ARDTNAISSGKKDPHRPKADRCGAPHGYGFPTLRQKRAKGWGTREVRFFARSDRLPVCARDGAARRMERDHGVRGTDAATGILAAIGAGFGRATEWADSCGTGDVASDVSTSSSGRAAHRGQHSGPQIGAARARTGEEDLSRCHRG